MMSSAWTSMKPFTDLDSHLVPPDLPARHHLYDAFELIVQRGLPGGRSELRRRRARCSACSRRVASTGFSR